MDNVIEHWDKYINMSCIHVQNTKSYTGKSSPITGPRCSEFLEVKVPRLRDNGPEWW